jgi:hypothetical protein
VENLTLVSIAAFDLCQRDDLKRTAHTAVGELHIRPAFVPISQARWRVRHRRGIARRFSPLPPATINGSFMRFRDLDELARGGIGIGEGVALDEFHFLTPSGTKNGFTDTGRYLTGPFAPFYYLWRVQRKPIAVGFEPYHLLWTRVFHEGHH